MPDFHHNDASIHYELIGSGPPLLMIAGIASDGGSWGPLTPLLADRHRLVVIDNRGAGRTRVDGPLSLNDMADDAAALLQRLDIASADVVGHSMGGTVGLLLAARHPGRVKRIVTMASGALNNKERIFLHDMARLYFTIPPADWFRQLYQWLFSAPFFRSEQNVATAAAASVAYPNRQSPGDFARQVAAIDSLGPIDLSRITVPVLALAAELDLISPPSAVAALHASIPNVTHRTIENAAHSIHWEAPEVVADAIAGFLR